MNDFNIEAALKKLEEINNLLASEEISMEETLALYSEGNELSKKCQEYLGAVDTQLQMVAE